MCRGFLEIGAGVGAHILKLAVAQIAEDRVRLFVLAVGKHRDVVENVAARDEQVLPAVVVEIEDAVRPSGHVARAQQVRLEGPLPELAVAAILEIAETIRSRRRCARCPDGRHCSRP